MIQTAVKQFKTIRALPDIRGKRVLLRIDANVPIEASGIRDDFRLQKILPTISMLGKKGARTILVSHRSDDLSLELIMPYFTSAGVEAVFARTIEDAKLALEAAAPGSFVMLENIRLFEGEESNDPEFAQKLANLADLYINDAFSASHRKHASIVGVPKFLPSYAGLVLEKEVAALSKMFDPEHPLLFILGGAKFETKLPLVEKFLPIADSIFVGGALSNDLLKAKGFETGTSLVSRGLSIGHLANNQKIQAPIDVKVRSASGAVSVKSVANVEPTDLILDAGPETVEHLSLRIRQSATILWNGPLGKYEDADGSAGTESLAEAVSRYGKNSIVGGGDTLAAISKLGLYDGFTFVSTGGGAMLDFLANETLTGIEALKA